MSVAYQCQLPGRRGMTLRLGEHRLSIDHDGMVRVPEDQQDWFRAQPLVWSAVGSESEPLVAENVVPVISANGDGVEFVGPHPEFRDGPGTAGENAPRRRGRRRKHL